MACSLPPRTVRCVNTKLSLFSGLSNYTDVLLEGGAGNWMIDIEIKARDSNPLLAQRTRWSDAFYNINLYIPKKIRLPELDNLTVIYVV